MPRWTLAVAAAALGGCSFTPATSAVDDARAPDDAPTDARRPAPDAPVDARATLDATPPGTSCLAMWKAGVVTLGPPVALTALNSATGQDRDPYVSADELTIYFASDRPGGSGATDVYVATRASATAAFGAPSPAALFDTSADDSKVSFAAGDTIAAVATNRAGSLGNSTDIWLSTKVAGAFVPFTEGQTGSVNTASGDYDPQLSSDGLRLYLAPADSLRQRIAVSKRTSVSNNFGAPVDLVADEAVNNGDPGLSTDELVMVFTSNRSTAPAGQSPTSDNNLWFVVRFSIASDFGLAMPVPGNTNGAEGDPVLSADACRLYYSLSLTANGSSYDLYYRDVLH